MYIDNINCVKTYMYTCTIKHIQYNIHHCMTCQRALMNVTTDIIRYFKTKGVNIYYVNMYTSYYII